MKRILLIVTVICISFSLFAQKVNSRGEYMVKSAIVEFYGGRDFSYKLDFEYNDSNDLIKVTRSGYHRNDKYVHVYTFRSGKYSDEKYIYYTGYKNGNVFDTNKNKPLCWLNKIYYNLECKSYNRFFVVKKEVYGDNSFRITTDYIYRNGQLQAIHEGTNSIGDNEIMMLTWKKRNIVSERMEGGGSWSYDLEYYMESEVVNNTNLNINFINLGGTIKTYKDENIGFTEWFGLNTTKALKGNKNGSGYGSNIISPHYEYELNGNLIKKIRYIDLDAGKEHDYIYGTLTLEYVY